MHHRLTVSGLIVHFLWVPCHCGSIVNEIADSVTKLVFRSNDESLVETGVQAKEIATKLSYSEAKSIIREHCLEKRSHIYIHSTTGSQYKWLFPQVQTKQNHQINSNFRLQTGHSRLNDHSHRIGKHPTGLCEVCKVPESVQNFLFQCPNYSHFRTVLKNGVESMGLKFNFFSILTNKCAFECVCRFIISSKKFSRPITSIHC